MLTSMTMRIAVSLYSVLGQDRNDILESLPLVLKAAFAAELAVGG